MCVRGGGNLQGGSLEQWCRVRVTGRWSNGVVYQYIWYVCEQVMVERDSSNFKILRKYLTMS